MVMKAPTIFLELTCVINLNSWAFYHIKIKEMAGMKSGRLDEVL